jgi:hypothetical protein
MMQRVVRSMLVGLVGAIVTACGTSPSGTIIIDRELRFSDAGASIALTDAVLDSVGYLGDVAFSGLGVSFTDVRDHRLVSLLPGRRSFRHGRRGSGPAEFLFPLYLDARPSLIVVGDQGNGRFQAFDENGHLLHSVTSPVPVRHFAVESDSTLLVALTDSTWYLARVHFDGRWEPVAARPRDRRNPGLSATLADVRGDQLVAMASESTFVVVDQTDGALREFDAKGRMLRVRLLPAGTTQQLEATRDEGVGILRKRFGTVLSAPLVKDLAGDRRGHLLLLFSAGIRGGLWIDVERGRGVMLLAAEEAAEDPLWSASSGDVSGDSIVIVSHGGDVRLRRIPALR